MNDRSAMHCELHRDYRCPKCFTVDGRDQSAQYVQGLEAELAEALKERNELRAARAGYAAALNCKSGDIAEKLLEVLCLLAESLVEAYHLRHDNEKMVTESRGLREALKLARETVADNVQHSINSYGDCSMTRCLQAELAEIDAALEGQGGEG